MNDGTNEDLLRLKQMLEEATAADASAEHGDAETASLREAWLAFGQLVRAADASLPAMPDFMPSLAPQQPRRSRWIALIAATAAVLLIAITCGWWIGHDRKPNNGEPSIAQTPPPEQAISQPETTAAVPAALPKQDLPKPGVAQAKKATNEQPKLATAKASTWDDPLETQIASVSQQIRNIEQNWRHRVDDLDLVHYRIDAEADSLQVDKL